MMTFRTWSLARTSRTRSSNFSRDDRYHADMSIVGSSVISLGKATECQMIWLYAV
jgi:hypothetical protein